MDTQVEVLAPAGSFASLTAALQGGADSVFFGVGALNMRSGSNVNFTVGDLPEVVATCHAQGVRCYLTANTIVYNEELAALRELLEAAQHAGVDAVIASDVAAIFTARELGLRVHISTQLSISNTPGVRFYSQWADVVVLARELTLGQVKAIADDIAREEIRGPSGDLVRIEAFAHGALCMAISGKCYLSLHEAARSANRGQCVQICRRSYTLTDTETGNQIEVDNEYLMSPKDLCTIDILDRLLECGVGVLKIEGRARSPEYVKVTTACYKQALAAIGRGEYTPALAAELKAELATVYNRGFWHGYYHGAQAGEWAGIYGSAATERKRILGVVTNYFSKAGVAEIRVETTSLSRGANLYIIGDKTGVVEADGVECWYEDRPAEVVPQGGVCTLRVPGNVRRGDKVFLRERVG